MLARAVVLAVVFGLVFELTCRVEDLIRYGTPMFSPFTSQSDLIVRDVNGARGRPNARFQKWVLNAVGTRGPEIDRRKPAGTLRVVTTGASETFGLYESSDREYPRQLEDSLRVSVASSSCRDIFRNVEVVNAALPGMSLPTVVLDLQQRIATLAPDYVVYYPTPPQYLDEHAPGSIPTSAAASSEPSSGRALYPRSVARLRNQAKTILPDVVQTALRRREVAKVIKGRPAGWRFSRVPEDRLNLFDRDLRRAVGAVRAAGASPVLATNTNAFLGNQPASADMLYAWERFYPRATGEVILAFDAMARGVIRGVARDSATALADVEAAVLGPTAFADFSHFTDWGAGAVAGVMARTVVAEVERAGCRSNAGQPIPTSAQALRP